MIKIAIVGAEEYKWKGYDIGIVKETISNILKVPCTLISGHCPKGGVDIWAEDYANSKGIETQIYKPQHNTWRPHGYEERNILIAQNCDVIYVISPRSQKSAVWNGGIWTGMYAKQLGKTVSFISITQDNKVIGPEKDP